MFIRAVRSVIRQKYKEGVLEIIGVIDKEKVDIIERFIHNTEKSLESKYKMILVPASERVGPSIARNVGLKNASYELVAFLDDDDIWLRNKLSVQLKILDRYGVDVIITKCINKLDSIFYFYPKCFTEAFKIIDGKDIFLCSLGLTSTVLARKDAILGTGGFNPDLKRGEDVELWIRITENGYRIGFLNIPTMVRYLHEENVTKSSLDSNYLKFFINESIRNLSYGARFKKELLANNFYGIGKRLVYTDPVLSSKFLSLAFSLGSSNIRKKVILLRLVSKASGNKNVLQELYDIMFKLTASSLWRNNLEQV